MRNTSLKHTKKRLTIIFTLLVFGIAVLLEWVFFTWKYYNYTYNEKKSFDSVTSKVENKFISLKDIISVYDVWKRVFRMRRWLSNPLNVVNPEDKVNLIIIDKNENELVFSNVTDNLNISIVEDALENNKYSEIKQSEWYLIKKIFVKENHKEFDVLFVKNLRYSFIDYFTDLFWFVFITLMFSVVFYYIWLKFVSKNLEPVERNLRYMQDFIHNAWHELKTPISIIHSNLQLIKATKKFDKTLVKEWLIEINRLDHLIESLVELSNINSVENIEKINLDSEILEIINDYKAEAKKKKIDINFKEIDKKVLTINKQYFYILLSNLIWNAIKYSKSWWKIEIILEKNRLIVKDNWIGISKKNLSKIFDRFFIEEKSRNIEWHWIWLSLVKKISDIYGWKIVVKSKKKEGSEFIIQF